jgi:Zn-dependent oligopeptidase
LKPLASRLQNHLESLCKSSTTINTYKTKMRSSDWGHSYVTSGHQMVYPGTLYQYISGFCFSEIMFKKVFANDPMNKKVGLRYRRLILEKGGSQHPLEMMENLLGEKPDIEAFCDNAVDE